MYSFFDKHGKKLLAVFSVLLMIAFLWNPYQRAQTNGVGCIVGGVPGRAECDKRAWQSRQRVARNAARRGARGLSCDEACATYTLHRLPNSFSRSARALSTSAVLGGV